MQPAFAADPSDDPDKKTALLRSDAALDLRADLLTYDQGEHFAIYVDLINTSNNSGGPYPITGVVREITLPAGLQFLNTTADTYSSCFFEGTTGTCTSDSFPANQQATSVFYVSSIEPGSMTISGTKTQNEFDPDLNNNLASITILIEEVPEGSISGSVFEDKNGNGIKDTGEVAESGVTIALSGAITGSAVTDGAGAYTFTGLPGGDYSVTVQTGTYMGGTNGQAWHASAPETGNHSVTLSSGEQVTGKDFMIWQEARARIQVLHDYNANRAFDPGYSGISAVNVVRVDECPFNVGAVVASDANGWTSFGGLGLQEYCFGIAANQSFPGGTNGTELLISVPAEDNGVRQASHTFISGENVEAVFGVYTHGKVTGTKFSDADGDGTVGPADAGLGGWTIELKDNEGTPVGTTVTAADGSYEFTEVLPGHYEVTEVLMS